MISAATLLLLPPAAILLLLLFLLLHSLANSWLDILIQSFCKEIIHILTYRYCHSTCMCVGMNEIAVNCLYNSKKSICYWILIVMAYFGRIVPSLPTELEVMCFLAAKRECSNAFWTYRKNSWLYLHG